VYILAEVALGDTRELNDVDYNAANLPPGKSATHALGRTQPDPNVNKKILDDVAVPLGKLVSGSGNMGANEYIVYNTN
jgi:Poly(ADP-ribose) polymerase catalytic domain